MSQLPIGDLDAGDSTPKVSRVSLKDVVEAINRISYAFKTPDASVSPDGLQLAGDGNLALGGGAPKLVSAIGLNFSVTNSSQAGSIAGAASMSIESASGTALLNITSKGQTAGIYYTDTNYFAGVAVIEGWDASSNTWKVRITDKTSRYDAITASNTGLVGIGQGSLTQATLNVGAVGQASLNEVFVASHYTNFEGVFLGAYDTRSGGKLDLNAAANATNVSSWRISHDTNDGGQGRLSFRFAAAATSRAGLTYAEKFAITSTGQTSVGSASRSVAGAVRFLHVENSNGQGSIAVVRNSNDTNGAVLAFGKTRGTANGANTALQDQDTIGAIQFGVGNGNTLDSNAAQIYAVASGAQSGTSTPGQLLFGTTPINAVLPVVAMRISNQQNVSIGTSSDVARLVISTGTSYPTGENILYLQSSSPGTIPALITGSSSGTTSISGGSPLAAGGARGGQIDLIGGGAPSYAGHTFIRTGTNADGQPGSTVFAFTPSGMFGVNTQAPAHRIFAQGNTGERIRVMMDAYGEYAGFTGRRANGTSTAPTKVLQNDALVFFNTHAYTGTQYVAGGQITIQADADWSDTATPSSIIFAPGHPTSLGQVTRAAFTSTGKFGFNALNPVAVMTVTSPDAATGVGHEIDPNPANGSVQIRSYDRSASLFKDYAVAARSIQLGVGSSSATVTAAVTTAGNFVVGQNPAAYVNGSGTGNATIDGQFIISANSYGSTALCISAGEKYAGMKIKVGPNTTPNGGADYYDITTRPGISGVASNADYTMIRLESALSVASPAIYLHPNNAGGKVIIGGNTSGGTASLQVYGTTGASAINMSGGNTSVARADMVISRSGTVENSIAGGGSSIQLSNGTNNTHVLLQHFNSGLQLFGYTGGAWRQNFFFSSGGTLIASPNATPATILGNGDAAEPISVNGRTNANNDYCYYAQAQTATGNAYALRMFSTTSNSTVGSIIFSGSSTAYNTSSDRRLKENIVDSPAARDILRAIQVRSFNFKSCGDFYQYGFIAQELATCAPWAVHKGSEDGSNFDGMNGVWSVDHSKLVPLLVKSQQETIDEVRDLKQQLVDTKAIVTSLEQRVSQQDALLEQILAKLALLEGKESA